MGIDKNNAGLAKTLTFWLGGYLIAAVILLFYFRVPPLPILFAGMLTFAITLGRYFLIKK